MNTKIKLGFSVVVVTGVALGAVGCASQPNKGDAQHQTQATTESAAQKLIGAEPYPLAQMNGSDERRNLVERLLRFNDPNKIGYFYGLSATGQVMFQTAVKGKISSTDSQLTNTQSIEHDGYPNGGAALTVDSIGDDGSYGPNEHGEFGFTPSGVMFEWNGPWLYEDSVSGITLTSKPLLAIDTNAKPTSDAGHLGK